MGMAAAGLNEQEVNAIFSLGDSNNDGEIDLQEFITVMCPSASAVVFKISKQFKGKEDAANSFKKIDINGDGMISKDEMRSCFLKLNPIEVDSIFALGDANGDGEIDLEEFLAVMVPAAGFSSSSSSSQQMSQQSYVATSSYSPSSSSSSSSVSMSF